MSLLAKVVGVAFCLPLCAFSIPHHDSGALQVVSSKDGGRSDPLVKYYVNTVIDKQDTGELSKTGDNDVDGLVAHSLSGGVPLVRLEFLLHDVPAWPDLPGAKFKGPPEFLKLLPMTLGNWRLGAGTEVTFTCPDAPLLLDVCDAWVFFYSCPQSCVGTYQGGLPGLLQVSGWERTLCAPGFVTGVPGTSYTHPMKSFRKQLAPGESTSFTLPGDAEFLAFGNDARGVDCEKATTAAHCAAPGQRCKWDGFACHNQDCRAGTGPPPPCLECPWLGLESRPPTDGPFGGPL